MPITEKVKFAKDREEIFRNWIFNEIANTIGDRGTLERKWRQQIIQWRARVIGDGVADVPFSGASDVELPLTAMHTDPVYADFMQTLHVPQNFWSVTGKRPDTVDIANALEEFIRVVEQEDIDMYSVNESVILDMIIHGTGIYKDQIIHNAKKVKDYNEAGEVEDVVKVTFKPAVEHVPLQDFFIPAYAKSIDPDAPQRGAPWVAQRFDLREEELRARAEGQAPFSPNYDKTPTEIALTWEEDLKEDDVEAEERREDQYVPFQDRMIELFEVWARFDVDGDGIEEDIVVVWSQRARVILRATFNPFMHGKRPFEKVTYMPSKGFYGIGIAEMDEWAQLVSSRLLNSTVDSAFLSNSIMLAVPFGANVSPDEPIYPGKIWPLGPNEKITDIKMGSTDPAMFQLLGAFTEFSEKRTGVGELRQGSIDGLPSRTPASTVLSILNEGKKRFDLVLSGMRKKALKRIGVRILQNLIQISKDDPRYIARAVTALGPEDGQKVAQILQGPLHRVEDLFGVSVTATSSQVNKEVEKQSLTALMQVLAQLYQFRLQLAQMLAQGGDPSILLAAAQSAFSGSTEMLKRMLEAYDIQNSDQYLVEPQQQAPGQVPGPAGGQPQAALPPGQAPGVPNPDILSLLVP